MRLSKSERAAVRAKFRGCCAYCGNELPEKWHADHLKPVLRKLDIKGGKIVASDSECHHPERHSLANVMPACPPCNLSKGRMDIETWRQWLSGHVRSLNLYHPIYRMAKTYGLVQETDSEVVFFFERQQDAQQPAGNTPIASRDESGYSGENLA